MVVMVSWRFYTANLRWILSFDIAIAKWNSKDPTSRICFLLLSLLSSRFHNFGETLLT